MIEWVVYLGIGIVLDQLFDWTVDEAILYVLVGIFIKLVEFKILFSIKPTNQEVDP